jgi:hypothetical protein
MRSMGFMEIYVYKSISETEKYKKESLMKTVCLYKKKWINRAVYSKRKKILQTVCDDIGFGKN